MSSLQIYYRVRQLKNFENLLIFGEVMGKSFVSCFFFDSQCSSGGSGSSSYLQYLKHLYVFDVIEPTVLPGPLKSSVNIFFKLRTE